jgi:Zn-dependent protease with chaperone function
VNFFAHQDRARSTTRKLVFLFICAVITLIIITSLVVFFLLGFTESSTSQVGFSSTALSSYIFIYVTLAVIAVVTLGSLFRLAQLRGGGKVVAEAMGGRLLNTATLDDNERKILNVVEEMAIASGTPVPPVYLMEDAAINAFAAGYKAQDAVIGITRGCIELLERDELQGVIAHEFSHIFNGDMRLNIRLIGLLYGIMVIGLIGYYILRGSVYRRQSLRSNNKGGGIAVLGLGLVAIGYSGMFFGNMIKAAVSRQREFLADASAVQFTRNPQGIAGALKKIGDYHEGSYIRSADTSEISHMLFCQGLKAGFTSLFATHPPLAERIIRLDPRWQGQFKAPNLNAIAGDENTQRSGFNTATEANQKTAVASIGEPSAAHLELAAKNLGDLPDEIIEDAHSSFGACMLVCCLMLELADKEGEKQQLQLLQDSLNSRQLASFSAIRNRVSWISRDVYLSLLDLCIPSLKQLSPIQYRSFMSLLGQMIVADNSISVFEWCIFKILHYSLAESTPSQRAVDITRCGWACEELLSALARIGHEDSAQAERTFNQASAELGLQASLHFRPAPEQQTEVLEKATDLLKNLKPLQKPRLLKAMAVCIAADGQIKAQEAELLRAVGALLDCPIPPLLEQQQFI